VRAAARSRWPFPGDHPVAIARKVAGAYREALSRAAPAACAEVDARMVDMGQAWVQPRVARFDPDDLLTEAEAADLAGVESGSIGAARRRGRLRGVRGADGRWRYAARDVWALSAGKRRRGAGDDDGGPRAV
jgi:hypothetical protein